MASARDSHASKALTLQEKNDAENGVSKSSARRRLSRRDTEAQVSRSLKTHFPDFSATETDQYVVDDYTLRQRLTFDTRRSKTTKVRLGSSYWAEMRSKYGSARLEVGLQVRDKNQEVSPQLISALELATHSNTTMKSRSGLCRYFAVGPLPNQRELVGVTRHMQEIRPAASTPATSFFLDFMHWVAKYNLQELFPDELGVLTGAMDQALVSAYMNMKREGLGLKNFYDIHRDIAILIMPAAPLDAVMSESDSWQQVSGHILELAEGSTIGERMFKGHLQLVMAETVSHIVDDAIAAHMPKGKTITAAMKTALLVDIAAKTDEISASRLLKDKRIIAVKYRGLSLKITIHSVDDEVGMRVMAHIKGLAAGGVLPELCFESSVFDAADKKCATAAASKEILKECIIARETANKALESQTLTGDAVREVLASKKGVLCQLDPTFVLELAMASALCGKGGQEWMQEKVLATLASADKPHSLDTSIEMLKLLASTDFYRFCTKTTQAALDSVREILADMKVGKAPNPGIMSSNTFLQKVAMFLPFFCQATKVLATGKTETVTGKHAIAIKYKEVVTKHKEAASLSLNELEIFGTFAMLLTDAQRAEIGTITKALIKSSTTAQKRASSSSAGAAKRAKKQTTSSDGPSKATSYFN